MDTLPIPVELRVAKLKASYSEVYALTTEDLEGYELIVIARPMTLGEFMHVGDLEARNEQAANEYIFHNVYDSCYSSAAEDFIPYDQLPFGVVNEIYGLVMETSKFANPDWLAHGLNEWRSAINFVFPAAQALIMKAFPQYKLEDIEDLTHDKLCKLIVMAEYAVGIPFDITPPEDGKKKEKDTVRGIMKEAEMNDGINRPGYIDFGAENQSINV